MKRVFIVSLLLITTLAIRACSGDDPPASPPTGTAAAGGGAAATAAPGAVEPLVLVREQKLMVREDKGDKSKERVLLQTPANTFPAFPKWSPDGKQIAFVQSVIFSPTPGADWGGDLYLVDAAGGTPKLLWKHDQTGAQIQDLTWDSSSNSIIFSYFLTLIENGRYKGTITKLQRVNVASGQVDPVIDGPVYPSMSADGQWMAYLTQSEAVEAESAIWVTNLRITGAAKQLVTNVDKYLVLQYPRISPDGKYVVFAAAAAKPQGQGPTPAPAGTRAPKHGLPMDLFRVDVTSGEVLRLTSIGGDEPNPTWSPDGKRILFLETGGLWEMTADGKNLKRIGEGAFNGQVDMK